MLNICLTHVKQRLDINIILLIDQIVYVHLGPLVDWILTCISFTVYHELIF